MRSQLVYGKLPRDVEEELSPIHIEKVWELLEEKFCFNVKAWKKEFLEYYKKQPQNISKEEAFVDFGSECINPILNMVLKRAEYHETWRNMLKYIVRK